MATGRIILPIPGGVAPDGSGSGNAPATPEKVVSSGTQTTNTPKLSFVWLLFDGAADEHWMWAFKMPGDYASGGTVRLEFAAKGTSGNVVWKAGIEPSDPDASDMDAAIFNAADLSSATAVANVQGETVEATIALTMTGVGANEFVVLFVGRDADNASDTLNSVDACLVAATLEYTTT